MRFFNIAAMAAGVAASGCANLTSAESAEQEHTNVILILIDDLSYFGVSVYGLESLTSTMGHFVNDTISTPNIDRLAREGVLCSHAYSHALSEATRVALMTGMNNGRNYIETKALHESQITFGDLFQRGGYTTGMYGKWKQSRGTKENPPERHISAFGWDDYTCFDMVTADQRHINPDLVINDVVTDYRKTTELDPKTGRRYFGPDIFNYKALEFIEKNQDNPFFLYYPMVLIHDDHKPTPDSKPEGIFDTTDERQQNDMREYLPDMIRYTDKMIGRVVDKVDELGLRENTLIVVMGDNGSKEFIHFNMKDGSVHQGGKGQTKYTGEQVPLILSMPGTIPTGESGEVRSYFPAVDVTDIYPTILEASGIEILNKEKIDGVSMWGQMVGKSDDAHRECIYKWYNANNKIDDPDIMVRYAQTPEFKYYAPHDVYPKGRLFDLRVDSLEYEGVLGRKLGWEKYWYSGLDLDNLTAEQQRAYEMLKAETDRHAYTKVESLKIGAAPKSMKVGESVSVAHEVIPANATRNGVIWHSSDPSIIEVDKFGVFTAHKSGEVTITLYSWDDAWPVANGVKKGGYLTTGVNDKIDIIVK